MMGIVLSLEQENERMSWRLLRALRYRFGRNTEKLAPAELKQLYLALGGDAAAPIPADGPLVPVPAAPAEVLNADGEVAAPNGAGKKRRKRKVGGATVVDDKVEKLSPRCLCLTRSGPAHFAAATRRSSKPSSTSASNLCRPRSSCTLNSARR